MRKLALGFLVVTLVGVRAVAEGEEQSPTALTNPVEQALRDHWTQIESEAPLTEIEIAESPQWPGLYVATCDWQANWWGCACCFKFVDGKLSDFFQFSEPTEQSIHSARLLKIRGFDRPLIEVYGKTHQGNGNIYLYVWEDAGPRLCLDAWAVDCHDDGSVIRGGFLVAHYRDINGDGLADVELDGIVDSGERDEDGYVADEWRDSCLSEYMKHVFLWSLAEQKFICKKDD